MTQQYSGSIAVCGGEDKAVHVVDFAHGTAVREWRGHERAVNRMAMFERTGVLFVCVCVCVCFCVCVCVCVCVLVCVCMCV